jgi:predicted transposase/invertase (TIGR01784 family)
MLAAEWNLEDAKAVWFEEGVETGMERGMEIGMEQGMERGMKDVARKMKAMGIPAEQINAITGLDIETIERLGD